MDTLRRTIVIAAKPQMEHERRTGHFMRKVQGAYSARTSDYSRILEYVTQVEPWDVELVPS
ncbi:hypothetical protein GCM10022402_39510 [Salinactinospora qingdaonensis]|uniref:Uncharacterized protein n=1 Tax=Salinactinospora qingdaonensis TaxID=702744 RepID=A0ABP7G618_9ACTN